jgi:leucyl-tRNA synthetase
VTRRALAHPPWPCSTVSTLLLTPFCPHTCEHIWTTLLGKSGTVTKSGFPEAPEPFLKLTAAAKYLEDTVSGMRKSIAKAVAPPKKGPKVAAKARGSASPRRLDCLL